MTAASIPRLLALVVSGLLVLTACGPGDQDERSASAPGASSTSDTQAPSDKATDAEHEGHELPATPSPSVKPKPLRAGERRVTLAMPEAYTPSAPNGVGTDDYRCFILDPQLGKDAYLTGTNVLPGNPAVVHHVIMFKLPPEAGAAAEQSDAADPGLGWTCFGNMGFGRAPGEQLDNAQWLGAWAPGGEEAVATAGFGTRLTKGTRIVMQVHYNLLAGTEPDISGMQLRLVPRSADLTELQTFLIPAPVELPCRPEHADGELCDRAAAVADVKARFGQGPGSTNDLLYFLCGERKKSGPVSSCVRTMNEPTTIRAVAGHMHLLGRAIKIEVNPGTPSARTILDIKPWNFDDQGARPVDPIHLQPFDTVKVTCRHAQWLRDADPAFETQREDRYVVWGEGTTDEMCLGILTITRP
ncbi:hypothetical protein [Nocardioides bigeumensis]|uniref:Copper type II ascorbate-dependent monooxygenase-like protein n=1 Tax=Nocardioides bigeumensis TaxID=433657 RepID=A0ABN2Y9E7_9ACTN